ncbi:NACHT domain-containing protein [Paractinoplanes atraurantiacus]|uniref:NACHT domain-containing protein n=1 Tax=Paractinoplanes atraurantiacus TaxID=1036182 RepID=A0A285J7B7_9ACTN|nr:NACHT domain-containing protein [Actinoplanes atraurantiacus]SNY56174.1 NACHT domain-containing protein [Actinoplanes atraurantiacus]
MTGVETALLNVGRAVVTPLFTRWLSGRRQTRERTLPLADLLQQTAKDEFTRRRGERQIEAVVDEVAERLGPLVTTRFAALPPHEAVAALDAVADTFRRADLTDDALFATDLDPVRLAAHLRRSAPPAGLSELGQRLYDVALDDCSRCFTQFVVRTAPFGHRAAVETLSRLTELTRTMSEALRHLAVGGPVPADFLRSYADVLTAKLNVLELVGVETQFRPRTTLSVAYISLAVTGDRPTGKPHWEPALLRHSRPDNTGAERVEQALAKRRRTLIRGEAGAGKSTLLRWLAVTAARGGFTGPLTDWNGRVPFLIKLRSWPSALPAPEQFLTGVADPIAGTMPPGWAHRQLAEGRALLLIDGVDELPADRRPRVRTWLRDLLDTYPPSIVVVTSRPPAAHDSRVAVGRLDGFDSLTLERLSPADVRALIGQWHRAARDSPSLPCPPAELPRYERSLLTRLAANRHLYRLAGNPLLAAMLCALNLDREAHLPPDRMGVYQAAVDMLLHRRDTERGVPSALPDMTARERLQLLQDLAWRLSLNNRSELSRTEAEAYLARRLAAMPRVHAEPGPVLDHLIERSGVLREPAGGRVDFVHRTFGEYLAAHEAAEQNMGGMLAGQAHLDTWREIIVMAAGHGNAPMRTELIEGLLRRADTEPRYRRALILLATACLETMPALEPPSLIGEILGRLDTLLPPRRESEARSLAMIGEPILSRLPRCLDGLTESQAAAVIDTVTLVNSPAALSMLAGYAADPRPKVQTLLIDAWRAFDPAEYATRVLAEAPLDDGSVTITEPTLLGATRHLRHLRTLRARFDRPVDVADLAPAPALTDLFLVGRGHRNLHLLDRYPGLRELHLWNGDAVTRRDVEGLAGLRTFAVSDGAALHPDAVAAVAGLTGLRSLHVRLGPEPADVSALTTMPALEELGLEGAPIADFGPPSALGHLELGHGTLTADDPARLAEAFPRLRVLTLSGAEWTDIAFAGDLPQVEYLVLRDPTSPALQTLRPPPRLRMLWLSMDDAVDLTPVVRLSQLTEIGIWLPTGRTIDLSPFLDWHGGPLEIAFSKRNRITGRKGLPPAVRIRLP